LTYTKEPYRLSFTSASSQLPKFIDLAVLTIESDFDLSKLGHEHLGKEKESTNIRQFRELMHRLRTLTKDEIELLAHGNLLDQKHISLLAISKTYRFIFDFIVEVLRDKVLVYDFEIRDSDYNSFVNRKYYDHPELESLSESTKIKIKTVLFRILSEVGLIDHAKSRVIQRVLLSNELEKVVVDDNPELLKIFLKPDREIAELINAN
jgi:hypothetical protein